MPIWHIKLRLDFLLLDELQDTAFELARSTEQRIFRIGHRKVVAETGLNQFESADEIGKLEESILSRLDGLRKLDFETRLCNEIPMQKVGDGGLSAVVVNLGLPKIISDEDYSPSLKAKNFLRFSKIPTFRLRSAILYHIQSAKRNGEFWRFQTLPTIGKRLILVKYKGLVGIV